MINHIFFFLFLCVRSRWVLINCWLMVGRVKSSIDVHINKIRCFIPIYLRSSRSIVSLNQNHETQHFPRLFFSILVPCFALLCMIMDMLLCSLLLQSFLANNDKFSLIICFRLLCLSFFSDWAWGREWGRREECNLNAHSHKESI